MYDHGPADNRIWTTQLDMRIDPVIAGAAGIVRIQIAEITGMSMCSFWSGMLFGRGVKVTAGRGAVRRAAVSELVNMESVQTGSQSGYLRSDPDALVHHGKIYRTFYGVSLGRIEHRHRFGRLCSLQPAICRPQTQSPILVEGASQSIFAIKYYADQDAKKRMFSMVFTQNLSRMTSTDSRSSQIWFLRSVRKIHNFECD